MLFCTEKFLLFFVAVFAVYWSLPWHRPRVYLLLGASFYFYASWDYRLALLICVSTTIDFFLARGIEAANNPRLRKLLLLINILGNLGLLCYFKYVNFFLDSLRQALQAAGVHAGFHPLEVILPVGISFYTFEAINYMVDVYRGHVRAQRSLPNFMLFILFFPHLVAGPIVRARDFLPQIDRRKRFSWPRIQLGMQYIVLGVFKKLAIADRLAQFADPVFAEPGTHTTHVLWIATLAYAVQVYCDFSGYSDLAIGTAHLLGYKLARNFALPYLAANISDFWRRWHISLSSWLRDYLFYPLGGSRGSRWMVYRNLLIVMTVCGLWHGANWTFVVFGAVHGCLLIIHRVFRQDICGVLPVVGRLLATFPGTVFRVLLTFTTFCLTLVIFRAATLGEAITMFGRMFTLQPGEGSPLPNGGIWVTVGLVAVCQLLALGNFWKRALDALPSPVRGVSYAAVLTLALILSPEADKAFIYFQF
jgi:alginate O-acetyltransferase complex protein AlgI